jgi:sorbitol-6-phosphate 2-dehydrogenase
VALVVGPGDGVGRAICLRLAEDGADVAMGARTLPRLEALKTEIVARGRRGLAAAADITDEAQAAALVGRTVEALGRLDILVYNAIAQSAGFQDLTQVTRAQLEASFLVNYHGAVIASREAFRVMAPRRSGVILLISSMVSKQGRFRMYAYPASKAALENFARSFAWEAGEANVRVNAVTVGTTEDARNAERFRRRAEATGVSYEQAMADKINVSPLRRLVKPEEVASVVSFLASDGASAMTGQAVNVTCGVEMR